jgi:hypothetical protein
MPTTVPVKDASGNTFNMVVNPAYDAQDDMIKMKSVQKKWRDSFTTGTLEPSKWTSIVGAGASISVTGGTLVMASGTTIAAETSVLSVETFTIPFRVQVGLTLSARILNQTFYIEAVSVDPVTLLPNGQHTIAWAFEGNANPTQGIYEVQNGGLARLRSAQSTVTTTAGTGVYELEPFADEAWFHSAVLDGALGRANSYRRHQQIPDPNAVYKIRFRWLNGASAPASSTNATIQYISVQDYAELTAEITAGRGNAVAGNAISVMLAGVTSAATSIGTVNIAASQTVGLAAGTNAIGDVGQQYRANATGAASGTHVVSAASVNATVVKGSAGRVVGWSFGNTSAAWRYVKLHNQTAIPTAGSGVVRTIAIPPNGVTNNAFEGGIAFTTGIGLTIVTGSADNDANAVGAGDVVGELFWS